MVRLFRKDELPTIEDPLHIFNLESTVRVHKFKSSSFRYTTEDWETYNIKRKSFYEKTPIPKDSLNEFTTLFGSTPTHYIIFELSIVRLLEGQCKGRYIMSYKLGDLHSLRHTRIKGKLVSSSREKGRSLTLLELSNLTELKHEVITETYQIGKDIKHFGEFEKTAMKAVNFVLPPKPHRLDNIYI